MPHNDFTRPGGVWPDLSVLLAAEIADIDRKTKEALSGDLGGTWSPASEIVIGGAGFKVTGAFTSVGGFGVSGSATFSDGLTVQGSLIVSVDITASGDIHSATFSSSGLATFDTLKVTSDAQVLGETETGTLICIGNGQIDGVTYLNGDLNHASGKTATFAGTLVGSGTNTLSGATTVSGSLTVSGSTNHNAPVTCNDTLALNDVTTASEEIRLSGDGRIRDRLTVVGTDGDLVFAVADGSGVTSATDEVYIPSGVLGANRTYTLKNYGASNGSTLTVWTDEPTSAVELRQADGVTTIATIRNYSGGLWSVRLKFASGAWRVASRSYMPLRAAPEVVGMVDAPVLHRFVRAVTEDALGGSGFVLDARRVVGRVEVARAVSLWTRRKATGAVCTCSAV